MVMARCAAYHSRNHHSKLRTKAVRTNIPLSTKTWLILILHDLLNLQSLANISGLYSIDWLLKKGKEAMERWRRGGEREEWEEERKKRREEWKRRERQSAGGGSNQHYFTYNYQQHQHFNQSYNYYTYNHHQHQHFNQNYNMPCQVQHVYPTAYCHHHDH